MIINGPEQTEISFHIHNCHPVIIHSSFEQATMTAFGRRLLQTLSLEFAHCFGKPGGFVLLLL